MYHFPLSNTKTIIYQFFAYGIILLNLMLQLYWDYAKGSSHYHAFTIVMSVVLLSAVGIDAYRTKRGKPVVAIGILLLVIAVRWFRFGYYAAFFINILLWILYTIARRKLIITISESHITYPSFPKKEITWQALNHVILKDDVLTIDCKNNKVYQHHIPDAAQFADAAAFNEFCRRQLIASAT